MSTERGRGRVSYDTNFQRSVRRLTCLYDREKPKERIVLCQIYRFLPNTVYTKGKCRVMFGMVYDILHAYVIGKRQKNALYFAKYIDFFQTQFTQKGKCGLMFDMVFDILSVYSYMIEKGLTDALNFAKYIDFFKTQKPVYQIRSTTFMYGDNLECLIHAILEQVNSGHF